jgi:hypothetical protein
MAILRYSNYIRRKDYMRNSLGIFQGKQEKYNKLILDILYSKGPLTAWEITGEIKNVGKVSLHATLNKRLRNLQKKGYLIKDGKKWIFQFKGIIASLLIQENPRPWSDKWNKLFDEQIRVIKKLSGPFHGATIQINGTVIHPHKIIDQSRKSIKPLNEWIALSNNIKELLEKGIINFDVISNRTLFSLLISQASEEELKIFKKNWKIENSLPQTPQRSTMLRSKPDK